MMLVFSLREPRAKPKRKQREVIMTLRRAALLVVGALALLPALSSAGDAKKLHGRYLYVVVPGIRSYLEFGGAGILVYDIDNDHKFVKRIATAASMQKKPENIKGVCACATTQKLYFTTLTKLYCVDLVSEK